MSSFFDGIEDQFSQYTWPRLIYSALRVPAYHFYFEIILLAGIIWLLFKRSYNINATLKLSQKEKDQLIEEWEPQPLVPASWEPPEKLLQRYHRSAVGVIGKYVQFEDKTEQDAYRVTPPHLNVASLNFLDLIGDSELNKVGIKALYTYGLGSCGPRGFYGTFDTHLSLEATLSKFLGVEEVALYSYGFSTIASAIPAYAKRNDIIFADSGVSQAMYEGFIASRSKIKYFPHNDIDSLENLLAAQELEDAKDPKKASQSRRFIAVEGIYLDSGNICPLPRLIDLKYRYKVRIIMEESISFGVLGATGRGISEHFDISMEHIDIMTGSLETAIGTAGGFCAGSHFVIDHQRLSGQGYCFSASLPPLLAATAEAGVVRLTQESGKRQSRLLELSRVLHAKLIEKSQLGLFWCVEGHPDSPVKHIRLIMDNSLDRLEQAVDLASSLPLQFSAPNDKIGDSIYNTPVLLTVARHVIDQPRALPKPSIRLSLNQSLTDEELLHICTVLLEVGKVLSTKD